MRFGGVNTTKNLNPASQQIVPFCKKPAEAKIEHGQVCEKSHLVKKNGGARCAKSHSSWVSCDGHHIFQTISPVLYLRQQIRRLTCANISVLAWLHLSLRCPSFSLRHSTQTEPLPTPSERWRGLRTSPRLVHFCQ